MRWLVIGCFTLLAACSDSTEEIVVPDTLEPTAHYSRAIELIQEGSEDSYRQAMQHLEHCAYQHPACAYGLGVIYHRGYGVERSLSRSLGWFEIAAVDGYLPAVNDIAWLLVTVEDDHWYNPTEALEWVDLMTQFPERLRSVEWDTIAAVYAANRLIDEAVDTQSRALDLAHQEGQSEELINEMLDRLQLYLAGKCYREAIECEPSHFAGPSTRL